MTRRQRPVPSTTIQADLTPMVDVTFLLIVFFALVTRISDSERVDLALPRVADGAATRAEEESRIILNAMPGFDGTVDGYLLAGVRFDATPDGIERLASALADHYRRVPGLSVRLRADRASKYEWIEPAMRATTTAARLAGGGALPRLDLVVETDAATKGRDGTEDGHAP